MKLAMIWAAVPISTTVRSTDRTNGSGQGEPYYAILVPLHTHLQSRAIFMCALPDSAQCELVHQILGKLGGSIDRGRGSTRFSLRCCDRAYGPESGQSEPPTNMQSSRHMNE